MSYPSEGKFPIELHSYLSCPAHHLRASHMHTRIFLAAIGMKAIYSNTRKNIKKKKERTRQGRKVERKEGMGRGGKETKGYDMSDVSSN